MTMVAAPNLPGARHPMISGDVELGLLNLLSGSARRSCERQIAHLLTLTSGPTRVRLRTFSLQPNSGARDGLGALFETHLDALFVSGAEPQATDLTDESFWPGLTQVIDWARTNTRTTIWSCLAAHAVVRHLDGVRRRRLPGKCTGLFGVTPVGQHPLIRDLATPARAYHSRWHDVAAADLTGAGYTILTRSEVGVDSFAKTCGSSFVFLQGHPEYDAGALGREYRRDIRRFLAETTDDYPTLPTDYYDVATTDALRRFEDDARRNRDPEFILHCPFPNHVRGAGEAPTPFGVALFRNWLASASTATTEHAIV